MYVCMPFPCQQSHRSNLSCPDEGIHVAFWSTLQLLDTEYEFHLVHKGLVSDEWHSVVVQRGVDGVGIAEHLSPRRMQAMGRGRKIGESNLLNCWRAFDPVTLQIVLTQKIA